MSKDKNRRNEEWASRYKSFGEATKSTVTIETKAAASIIENGVDVRHIHLVKALYWIMFADVIVIAVINMAGVYAVSDELILSARMIALFATGWPIFGMAKTAIKIFGDYIINIEPACNLFTSSITANNALKKGYTKELILIPREEVDKKILELKKKLLFDIDKKVFPLFCIFMIAGCFLWAYVSYWDVKIATIFGLGFGILGAIVITLCVHIINKKKG